ncbi:hypothetical protein BSZ39_05620 [Bowdeniella nasicola]|uniref:DUF3152 domain-containing protein n=1 Tax=Bowdeniella nasicola TaxID=208480 RepID=A0A1Q5Q385_9ACTO|nr:hypothetical protein BSZ39_05620 [Bowdeniella nasicola]
MRILILVILVGSISGVILLPQYGRTSHASPPSPSAELAVAKASPTPTPTPSPAPSRTATPTPSPTPSPAPTADEGGMLGGEIPQTGSGTLNVVSTDRPAADKGERWTYRVEVEEGLPVDTDVFAERVHTILSDERSWPKSFEQVAQGGRVRVILASPATVDRLCAPLPTRGRVSCQRGDAAVINVLRWAQGAEPFFAAGGTLVDYRNYVVNHEVGHLLSQVHEECSGEGELAHVMQQQTLKTAPCKPNGWPRP